MLNLVCSYFLFLPGFTLEECIFPKICTFPPQNIHFIGIQLLVVSSYEFISCNFFTFLISLICILFLFSWWVGLKAYQFCLPTQFSLVAQSRLTLCHPMDCSTPSFPVHHQLTEFAQTHVHRVSDAIQHLVLRCPLLLLPLIFSSVRVFFQWVSSSHQVTKVVALQLQHQSFQWILKTDFL